jgi:hypothetical protein
MIGHTVRRRSAKSYKVPADLEWEDAVTKESEKE